MLLSTLTGKHNTTLISAGGNRSLFKQHFLRIASMGRATDRSATTTYYVASRPESLTTKSLITSLTSRLPRNNKQNDHRLSLQVQDLLTYGEIGQVCGDNFWKVDKTPGRVVGKPRWETAADLQALCLLGTTKETAKKFEGAEVRQIYTLAGRLSEDEGNKKSSSWQGYMVICKPGQDKKREIIFAFRGTMRTEEWITNTKFRLVDYNKDDKDMGRLHRGFWTLYSDTLPDDKNGPKGMSAKQLIESVLAEFKDEIGSVSVTGHSLGAATATVCAFHVGDYMRNTLKLKDVPITTYSYGSPRVGNKKFKKTMEDLGVHVWRVANQFDVVTMLPPAVMFVGHVADDDVPGTWWGTFTDNVFDTLGEAAADLIEKNDDQKANGAPKLKESAKQVKEHSTLIKQQGSAEALGSDLQQRLEQLPTVDSTVRRELGEQYTKDLKDMKERIEKSMPDMDDDNSDVTLVDWEDVYCHVGTTVSFDSLDEPDPKHWKPASPGDFHNLEVYMYMLAKFMGKGMPRDPILMNKAAGPFVNPLVETADDGSVVKYNIPSVWWNPTNRNGSWEIPDMVYHPKRNVWRPKKPISEE